MIRLTEFLFPFRASQEAAAGPYRQYIPPWLIPRDPAVVEPYYLGGGASIPVKKSLLDSADFKKGLKPFEKPEVYAESAATVRAWRVPGRRALPANTAEQH